MKASGMHWAGAVTAGLLLTGVGLTIWRWRRAPLPATKPAVRRTEPGLPQGVRALKEFVHRNAASPFAEVQDSVGAARIRIAYAAAHRGDWEGARKQLVRAAALYRGTGTASADFGGIRDQADYQAIVCLVAEGRKARAEAGFERFMRERPSSPLVQACYRRLWRLNGRRGRPDWDALLQKDILVQEHGARLASSDCGPACLQRLIETGVIGPSGHPGLAELQTLCGQDSSGTSVISLRRALAKLGVASFAFRLNRTDLERAPLPLIALEGDHYMVLERLDGSGGHFFDPRIGQPRTWNLPPADDPGFSLTVITLRPMDLGQMNLAITP